MEEAYSHEVYNAGWWPLHRELGPAFFGFVYPEPAGYRDAVVRPGVASFDLDLGEFILRDDDVRRLERPDQAVLAFLEDTYARGADLAGWPREALESPSYPVDGPPRHAWSTHTSGLIPGEEPRATSAGRQGRDGVDAQSEQSFPASDPPSWPGAAL